MANNSDSGEAFAVLAGMVLIVGIIIIIAYITLWVVGTLLGIGAVVGVGHALYNYQQAFAANVHTEN
jgi:hypothetical protein